MKTPRNLIAAVVLTICVWTAFFPCLSAGFLNWDDDINLLNNPAVRSLDAAHLKLTFSQSVQKIYIPLTTLTYAIEHHFVGFHPFLYHLDNVILHWMNTFLVFYLAMLLGIPAPGACVAALLFGIHPMKAESVAWVTERKDVLYAFFYLLALIAYVIDIQRRGTACRAPTRYYYAALGCCILSLLSKPMALSLPLILVLIDWFLKRPWSRQTFLEKIPFFVITAVITAVTYLQHVRNPITDYLSALLIWMWSLVFYLWKFVIPVVLLPLYRTPNPIALTEPGFAWPLLMGLAVLMSLFFLRKRRWWIFAIGYYLLSIFFLLRFDVGVDLNIVADRFMYLPCLGICLAIGHIIGRIDSRRVYAAFAVIVVLLMAKTFDQSKLWRDPMTLWTYVIAQDVQSHIGYNNRGNLYNERDELNEAMADYQRALTIYPNFARALNNRGVVYAKAGRNDDAMTDFNRAIELKPDFEEPYYNRAVIKERYGQYADALVDAQKAQRLGAPVPEDFLSRLEKFAGKRP